MDEIDEAERGAAEIGGAELLSALRGGQPLDGGVAGAKRSVSAALLRRCCHELEDQVDPRGLRLRNALITGCLDLAGLTVPFPLLFEGCEFDSAPVVEGADLFELALTGCPRLPGLLGNGLRLRRDLDLSGSRVAGKHWTTASTSRPAAIWLCESEIGGRLLCVNTTIDGQGGRAMQADRIGVGGAIRLIDQFRSRGEIRLLGVRLGGSLDLTSAYLESIDGPALGIGDATVNGSVFLTDDAAGNRTVIRGCLSMESARISARFLIRNATIEAHPGRPSSSVYADTRALDMAMSASRLSVGAELTLEGQCEVTGSIDMSIADVSRFSIGAGCVLRAPGRTALDLTNAEIRAFLRLDKDAAIEGTLRLAGAVSHGTLALHGRMEQPEDGTLISGPGLTVEGHVYLNGLRTVGGAVTFIGATLGSLSARGAQLSNPDGYTMHLSQALIHGPVRLIHGFTSTGLVALNRTTVEGRLHCTGGTFHCPHPSVVNEAGHAIEATAATVHGSFDLGWTTVSPSVDFTDLTASSLADDPATWPERFTIAGMTYNRLGRPQGAPGAAWDHVARIRWLAAA